MPVVGTIPYSFLEPFSTDEKKVLLKLLTLSEHIPYCRNIII